jgi:ABC-type glycerol-3-phosphate transport system substrate-binding protein
MISMNLIRRAVVLTAATAMAALVTAVASACGGAATVTGATTNGLEKKSSAEVLQQAAAALEAAKSVHVVGTSPSSGHLDVRLQGGSSTGTFTQSGVQIKFTIIGNDGYIKADQAGLKQFGAPLPVQRHDAGRWLKVRAQDFTGLTLRRPRPPADHL